MALRLSFDTVAFIKTRIEPLRRVRHAHLVEDRIHQFVIEHLRIFRGRKISVTLSPHSPAICKTVCYLFRAGFTTRRTVSLGNTSFAKIFLGKNVGSDLAPLSWYLDVFHFEHHFPVWVPYYT